jgi:hypothetical protein
MLNTRNVVFIAITFWGHFADLPLSVFAFDTPSHIQFIQFLPSKTHRPPLTYRTCLLTICEQSFLCWDIVFKQSSTNHWLFIQTEMGGFIFRQFGNSVPIPQMKRFKIDCWDFPTYRWSELFEYFSIQTNRDPEIFVISCQSPTGTRLWSIVLHGVIWDRVDGTKKKCQGRANWLEIR